jgi:murein DD-endopeptidase MepM/ murein hydrolase activator NlpD
MRYPPAAYDDPEDELYDEPYYDDPPAPRRAGLPVDGGLLVGLAFLLILLFAFTRDALGGRAAGLPEAEAASAGEAAPAGQAAAEAAQAAVLPGDPGDPQAFQAPYDEYTLTQGIHGESYGQMAIDLAAGRGAAIKSPINGYIADKYVDEYGNTTLVIENSRYIVTLLHGKFTADKGSMVRIGDTVGKESNRGYTMDMDGRVCNNEPGCGYHTHLNVYDKEAGKNVNPLKLIK